MTKAEFRDALCILRSIDLYELQTVGLWCNADESSKTYVWAGHDWEQWVNFRDAPYEYFIRADNDSSDRIWAVIEQRQQKGTP